MWCRSCHREVASVPNGNGILECPFCGNEPTSQLKQSDGRMFRMDKAHIKPEHHIESERSSGKSKPSNQNPEVRPPRRDRGKQPSSPIGRSQGIEGQLGGSHWINLTGFFVFVFLVGQVFTLWAFLAGHFGAWVLGQLFVSTGLAVSLWLLIRLAASLYEQNHRLQSELRMVRENGVPKRRKLSRRRTRKSHLQKSGRATNRN